MLNKLQQKMTYYINSSSRWFASFFANVKEVYLDSTVILNPQVNTIYRLKISGSSQETHVQFIGAGWDQIQFFDYSSGVFKKLGSAQNERYIHSAAERTIFVNKDTLPTDMSQHFCTPIIITSPDFPGQLLSTSSLSFSLESSALSYHYTKTTPIKTWNDRIVSYIQPLVPDISVRTEHPIFLEEERPTVEQIESIYQKFLAHNDKEKLLAQCKDTANYCSIRAHFMNLLLRAYGITSVKIHKLWNQKDWDQFSDHTRWLFHAAVMVVDNQGQSWILDPWEYGERRLLNVTEWLKRDTEPTPIEIVITSCALLTSELNSNVGVSMAAANPEYIKTVQYLLKSAVPHAWLEEDTVAKVNDMLVPENECADAQLRLAADAGKIGDINPAPITPEAELSHREMHSAKARIGAVIGLSLGGVVLYARHAYTAFPKEIMPAVIFMAISGLTGSVLGYVYSCKTLPQLGKGTLLPKPSMEAIGL